MRSPPPLGPSNDAPDARRYFIAIGVARNRNLPEEYMLPSVTDDVARLGGLFCDRFGYERGLTDLWDSPTSVEVRGRLSEWLTSPHRRPTDIVVIYYSGHGIVHGGRYYLLTSDSDLGNPLGTAFAIEDLAHMVGRGLPIQNLLVIVDACYSGQALRDIARELGRVAQASWPSTIHRPFGWWYIAASRPREEAQQTVFATAFEAAVLRPRVGYLQRYLSLDDLVAAVNERFGVMGLTQEARLGCAESAGLAAFVPNIKHPPAADAPVDPQAIERVQLTRQEDLHRHWMLRARGLAAVDEAGWYFSGRTEVLQRLVRWLSTPDASHLPRCVTGDPGSGKSAVLGWIVTLAEPTFRLEALRHGCAPGTVPPERAIDAAIYARKQSVSDLVAALALELHVPARTPEELVSALRAEKRDRVVVIDGLDEATNPREIIERLILPLTKDGPHPSLKLILGARRPMVALLGRADVYDLDAAYFHQADVAEYVFKILLAAEEPESPSPYRNRPDLAGPVADAVAAKAGHSFLIASLVARDLLFRPTSSDVEGLRQRLPDTVGEAFDRYLEDFGEDQQRVRDMLRPVAWAEGFGLPWEQLWAALARALGSGAYTDDDVAWVRERAAAYLVESREAYPGDTAPKGRSVYRLYHQMLSEHLRDNGRPAATQSRVVDALIATVPVSVDGRPEWSAAHPYITTYLAIHAAAAGRLVELLDDPAFLLAADPDQLLMAIGRLTPAQRQAAPLHAVYQRVVHHIRSGPVELAASYLAMMARQTRVDAVAERLAGSHLNLYWDTVWAYWRQARPYRLAKQHGEARRVTALRFVPGQPTVVSGGEDGQVIQWNVARGTPVGEPIHTGTEVAALAVANLGEGVAVVAGGNDGTMRAWRLLDGAELGPMVNAHRSRIVGIEVVDGRPLVVSAGADGVVRLWRYPGWTEADRSLRPRPDRSFWHRLVARSVPALTAMAVGHRYGDVVVVTAAEDKRLRVWNVDGEASEDLADARDRITALATATFQGQYLAFSGGEAGVVRCWDLVRRREIGAPLAGHRRGVESLATRVIGDRLLIVSGGWDGTIRLWDWQDHAAVGAPLVGHRNGVPAVDVLDVDGVAVIVSGGQDGTVRLWECPLESPAPTHDDDAPIYGIRAMCVMESADGVAAVTGTDDGGLRLWRWDDGTPLYEMSARHPLAITAVVATHGGPDPILVSGGWDERLRFWNGRTGSLIAGPRPPHRSGVLCLAAGDLGRRSVVVSGGEDGIVRMWDVANGSRADKILLESRFPVRAVALGARRGVPVVVVAAGGTVYVTDPATGLRAALPVAGSSPVSVLAAAPAPDARMVWGGTEDGRVVGWDLNATDGSQPREVDRHHDRIDALAVARWRDQPIIASGSADGTVRLALPDRASHLAIDVGSPVTALHFGSNGCELLIGSAAGLMLLRVDLTRADGGRSLSERSQPN
jgi:WD40 repeat protein